jgi:acyl carrier protein
LRNTLKQRLPYYMLPTAFVVLDAIPLTPSGKIDRQALPAPGKARPELDSTFAQPRNEIERQIASIWQEVLGVADIGVEDNFFDLGGHSLLMVQVLSKLQEVFQKEQSMIAMFQYPTVSALAEYLSQGTKPPTMQPSVDRAINRRELIKRRMKSGERNGTE